MIFTFLNLEARRGMCEGSYTSSEKELTLTLSSGDDGSSVSHSSAGRSGDSGDEGHDRLGALSTKTKHNVKQI